MPLNRRQISQLYRPVGPKPITTGIAFNAGGTYTLPSGSIDLSLPIRGLRCVLKGRVAIGTAPMASLTPEGLLNLISGILLQGTNARQGGNVTLYNIDLATLIAVQHELGYRNSIQTINGTIVAIPSTPYANTFAGQVTNYDFIIAFDLPFAPFDSPAGVEPGFLVRESEWHDSLQLAITFGNQPGGAVAGALGTGAGGTTVAFTAFGAGTGSPSLDVYSLPMIMGLDLKDSVLPGFCTRISQPVSTPLQSAGNGITLFTLQKQATGRIFFKTGTATAAPAFATLSDTNVTSLGLTLGGNRNVRNLVDIWAHKQTQVGEYVRDPIQGYMMFDFLQSGNPDSAYPGDKVDPGSTFQVVANVAGAVNGYGIVVQEQILYRPEGALYSF